MADLTRDDASDSVATPEHKERSEHDDKRQRIIEAAAEVFYDHGFVSGTTKEVAGRIGLSQPAIYHYVGSKETLLHEIAMQVDREMLEALQRGLDSGDEPVMQLRGIIREFTRAVIDNRKPFAVYYKELHSLEAQTREQITRHERDFVAGVAGVVAKLQRDGNLPEDRPTTVLTEGIVGMISWVHRWYRPEGPLDADAIAETLMGLIGLSHS